LAAPQGGKLVAILEHSPQGPHRKVNVRLLLDGQVVAQKTVTQAGQFALTGSSPKKASVIFEIRSDSYFVPRLVHGTPDDRKLSLQLLQWYVEKTP
jgi:hypothetical protein